MAVPRVFVSSTYYDLKQYRSNIETFIKSLGYDPIMHERSKVAYTQTKELEIDCYRELENCDIVVCIIGNHFGTKSSVSDLSITMEELKTAIKNKKKIYIFISRDVFLENRTYEANGKNANFKSAYVDNIKIHEFISELKETVRTHVMEPFDTTDEIIQVLREQFAGLFQDLLSREASMTDAKTAYDLQESVNDINNVVQSFIEEKDAFFKKFDSTYFVNNMTLTVIKQHLGLKNSVIFANDIDSLEEILFLSGFCRESDIEEGELFKYSKTISTENETIIQTLTLCKGLFDEENNLLPLHKRATVEENLRFEETSFPNDLMSDELPF